MSEAVSDFKNLIEPVLDMLKGWQNCSTLPKYRGATHIAFATCSQLSDYLQACQSKESQSCLGTKACE